MRRSAPSADQTVAPNLVPMVDIMFLLLLFLMVGSDMSQRELEEVQLPHADAAREDDPERVERRLTLNVHHPLEKCPAYSVTRLCADRDHWAIGIKGDEFGRADAPRLAARLVAEAQIERERTGTDAKQPSPLRVMVRADEAALYELVQQALSGCADAGLYKVEIGAAIGGE